MRVWANICGGKGRFLNAETKEVISEGDYSDFPSRYGHKWFLFHRVDLHNSLRKKAVGVDGPGSPVEIHLDSKVEGVVSLRFGFLQ
jgi:hypothetical protein